jgi:superfamily I DNA/RNA helicase
MSVEQAHMKDVLCYLRIMQKPYDELALLRVLKMLPRVGSALSQNIWQHISRVDEPLKLACESDTANLLPVSTGSWAEADQGTVTTGRTVLLPGPAVHAV